jgi:hypothetical protein
LYFRCSFDFDFDQKKKKTIMMMMMKVRKSDAPMSQGAESHGGRGGCGAAPSSSAPPGPGERGSTLSISPLSDLLRACVQRLVLVGGLRCCSGARFDQVAVAPPPRQLETETKNNRIITRK